MLWTEKYRPKVLEEIVGNEEAKLELLKWVVGWQRGVRKDLGVLLTGPPGVGKTTAVYALANMLGFHVVELNASDYRTAQKIYAKVGYLTQSNTLDSFTPGGRRLNILLFFDEIDGIDPKADYGGLKAVLDIASRREIPVIAAANVPDPVSHKELLKNFKVIEFKPLTPRHIILLLKRIVMLEGLDISEETVRKIAGISRGDARLAVNLLQEAASGIEIDIISTPMENLPFDILMKRLSSSISIVEIRNLLNSNSNQIETVFYTYFDMILKSGLIDIKEKIRLLRECSKLDILFGRMNRKRRFFLFKYISTLLPWLIYSANRVGVVYDGKIPQYRLRLFIINRGAREELKSLYSTYLKGRLHCSYRKFVLEFFPMICGYLREDEFPSLVKLCKSGRYGVFW